MIFSNSGLWKGLPKEFHVSENIIFESILHLTASTLYIFWSWLADVCQWNCHRTKYSFHMSSSIRLENYYWINIRREISFFFLSVKILAKNCCNKKDPRPWERKLENLLNSFHFFFNFRSERPTIAPPGPNDMSSRLSIPVEKQ